MKKIFFGLSVLILMVMVYPNQAKAELPTFVPILSATLQEVSTWPSDYGNSTGPDTMVSTFKISLTSNFVGNVYIDMVGDVVNPLVNTSSFEIKRDDGLIITNAFPGSLYDSNWNEVTGSVTIPKCPSSGCTPVVFYIKHTFTAPKDSSYQVTLKKLGWTTSPTATTQNYTNVDFKTGWKYLRGVPLPPSISNVKVHGLKNNKWIGGEFKTITWDSVRLDRNVNIDVGCAFSAGTWTDLVNDGIQRLQLNSNLGIHQVGDDCALTVSSGAGETYLATATKLTFTIQSPTFPPLDEPLTLDRSTLIGNVMVDGWEKPLWVKGDTRTIKWNKASTTASNVDIILCQDHPYYNCWPTLAMNTLNDGSQEVKVWVDTGSMAYQWPVYAKVRSITPQKVGTSTPFMLVPPIGNVQVSGLSRTNDDPNYYTWVKGQTKTVSWTIRELEEIIPTVDIFICKASTGIDLSKPNERCRGTMNGMVISTNTANDGTEQIKIPTDPNFFTPGTDYEIFIRKLNSPSMGASSTDRFRIIAPVSVGVGQANPNDSAMANVLSSLQTLLTQLSGLLKR